MVGPSYLRPLHHHPLHVFSIKLPSSSTSSSTKLKTFIFSHFSSIFRAFSKAKSILVESLKENQSKKNKHKIFFGSFRLHYNWCSNSNVMPVPAAPVLDRHLYYDSTWNSVVSTDKFEDGPESQLSGYLHWLEDQKVLENSATAEQTEFNEIDRLADIFIANCHEKFILEKQESYRRFQEMLARSL